MVSRMSSWNFLPKYLGNPSVSGRFKLICVFCQVLAMCRPQQTAAFSSSAKVEIFSLILHKVEHIRFNLFNLSPYLYRPLWHHTKGIKHCECLEPTSLTFWVKGKLGKPTSMLLVFCFTLSKRPLPPNLPTHTPPASLRLFLLFKIT